MPKALLQEVLRECRRLNSYPTALPKSPFVVDVFASTCAMAEAAAELGLGCVSLDIKVCKACTRTLGRQFEIQSKQADAHGVS